MAGNETIVMFMCGVVAFVILFHLVIWIIEKIIYLVTGKKVDLSGKQVKEEYRSSQNENNYLTY